MAETPGSKDRALEALDFIINVIKEHEKNLDTSIHELSNVVEKIGDTDALNAKMERAEEKVTNLQKEVTNLISYLTNSPKETSSDEGKKQESQTQATPVSPPTVQVGSPIVLHCKQWTDFQALSMHAQTLTFNFKETEKVFQADAIKEHQLITYTGALPNFSTILKTWLSIQLETTERNIIEGVLDKPK
jgi:hypothetical protein